MKGEVVIEETGEMITEVAAEEAVVIAEVVVAVDTEIGKDRIV